MECGEANLNNQEKINKLKNEIKQLESQIVEFPCGRCGQEVDVFGFIINGKEFCGDCAEPHITEWFDKHGRIEMDQETQKKVYRELMEKE